MKSINVQNGVKAKVVYLQSLYYQWLQYSATDKRDSIQGGFV